MPAAKLSESSCSALVLKPALAGGRDSRACPILATFHWQPDDPALPSPMVRPRSQRRHGWGLQHSGTNRQQPHSRGSGVGPMPLASMTTTQAQSIHSPVQHALSKLTLPLQDALTALHCAAHARFPFGLPQPPSSVQQPSVTPSASSSITVQQQQAAAPTSSSSSAFPKGKHRQKTEQSSQGGTSEPASRQQLQQQPSSPATITASSSPQATTDSDQQESGAGKSKARAVTNASQQAQLASTPPNDPWYTGKLLIAGAMSAVVSRTFVAPLERVKVELVLKQGAGSALATAAQVFRTEGVPGFWKGNVLNLLRTAPFKAVNFSCFDTLHKLLASCTGVDGNMERFAAGALAGITATLVCFPLDVVRTRLMSKARGPFYGAGPFRTLMGILRNEGAAALYTGCLPAVIGMAPAGAVFYGVYDLLKHRHLEALTLQAQQQAAGAAAAGAGAGAASERARAGLTGGTAGVQTDRKGGGGGGGVEQQGQHGQHTVTCHAPPAVRLSAMYTLLYGALAGAASELIVYPLEVVRRRMQMHTMAHAAAGAAARGLAAGAAAHGAAGAAAGGLLGIRAGLTGWPLVVATCEAIIKAEGLRGFYTGLSPNMLQVLPSAALSYFTYDTVKQVLEVVT